MIIIRIMFIYSLFFNPTIHCSTNTAILLNSSISFHNYRHNSNIAIFYDILKRNNFKDSDIKYMATENIIYDKRTDYIRSMKTGYVQIEKDEYIELRKYGFRANSNNDNSQCNLNDKNETIVNWNADLHDSGNSSGPSLEKADINNFLSAIYQLSGNNAIIYLCGHGGEYFLKFQNKQCLFAADLMRAVVQASRNVNKLLLIIDTCHAETMVETFAGSSNYVLECIFRTAGPFFGYCGSILGRSIAALAGEESYFVVKYLFREIGAYIWGSFLPRGLPDNISIICTSKSTEPSISSHCVDGPSLVDNFPYIFNKKFDPELTFKEFLKLFSYEELGSCLVYLGDENVSLKEFFVQNEGVVFGFNDVQ